MEAAAVALAAAEASSKLVDQIDTFANRSPDSPGAIAALRKSIQALPVALGQVGRVFEQRPYALELEARHHQDVVQIIRSCERSLGRLTERLPQLKDEAGALPTAEAALVDSIQSDDVRTLLSDIETYTQVLQLSLISIALGSLWETRRSKVEIQAEIRRFTDEARSSKLVFRALDTCHWPRNDAGYEDWSETSSPALQVQAWASSAEYVATAISLHEFDPRVALTGYSCQSLPLNLQTSNQPPHDATSDEDGDDAFEPEPDRIDLPSEEILEYQLDANQAIVKTLIACGVFGQASQFQKKGIQIREDLCRVYQVPFPSEDRIAMTELLADILTSSQTKQGMREAKLILQDLLTEECKLPQAKRSSKRLARYYHNLGGLLMQLGNLEQAIKFLGRALEGRKSVVPPPSEDIIETTNLLVESLQLNNEVDKAHGYKEWLRREVGSLEPKALPQPPVNIDRLAQAYTWCRRHGFDVESPLFSFESLDSRLQTTPLHKAVQDKAVEIVKVMLNHDVRVNASESVDLPAPIELAASTKDKATVTALLEKGANVDIRDKSGMTPLHRCQSRSGGTEAAGLLLDRVPSIIDVVDKSGKTALFMAIEMGNVEMVQFLLDQGADPNICHQPEACITIGSLCTPLIAAIQVVRAQDVRKIVMVEALLSHGADPRTIDMDGRDAIFFATHAGLASREIKALMQRYAPTYERRPSNMSDMSASSHSSEHTTATATTRFSWRAKKRLAAKAEGK